MYRIFDYWILLHVKTLWQLNSACQASFTTGCCMSRTFDHWTLHASSACKKLWQLNFACRDFLIDFQKPRILDNWIVLHVRTLRILNSTCHESLTTGFFCMLRLFDNWSLHVKHLLQLNAVCQEPLTTEPYMPALHVKNFDNWILHVENLLIDFHMPRIFDYWFLRVKNLWLLNVACQELLITNWMLHVKKF